MPLILRPYQREAVTALWETLRQGGAASLLVLPTGAGKSLIVAEVAREAVNHKGRLLVLTHVKELLEQLEAAILAHCPGAPVGVYSAGLNRRQVDCVTVAGIQSVAGKAGELGKFDLVLIDEAHLLTESEDGQYRALLSELRERNPNTKLIGLTATPFRLSSGLIAGEGQLFERIAYEVSILRLIQEGYLTRLTSKASANPVDTSGIKRRLGEFAKGPLQKLMNEPDTVFNACEEIVSKTSDRGSVLVFCSGVDHAKHVAQILRDIHGQPVAEVYGDTRKEVRADALSAFKSGEKKYLVNVSVLTTGFDAPNVDCVVLLRATLSAGLYAQILGRGTRLHDGKADCLVLDFGGNINRHGPIDKLSGQTRKLKHESPGPKTPPAFKTCPGCQTAGITLGTRECPDCGHEWTAEQVAHEERAASGALTSDQIKEIEHDLIGVRYELHIKKGAEEGAPRTMRVDYMLSFWEKVSEWVCVEHEGFAKHNARTWWERRSHAPMPDDAQEAVDLANQGLLAEATRIKVRPDGNYSRVTSYQLGPVPAYQPEEKAEAFGSGNQFCSALGIWLPNTADEIHRAYELHRESEGVDIDMLRAKRDQALLHLTMADEVPF